MQVKGLVEPKWNYGPSDFCLGLFTGGLDHNSSVIKHGIWQINFARQNSRAG